MKDLIEQGLLELIHTPTDELVADILTKPLTGWKFFYLLGKLLGCGNSKVEMNFNIAEEVCWKAEAVLECKNMMDVHVLGPVE